MRQSIGVRSVLATAVSAVALLTAAPGAMAQANDPLLQLLVKKGVVSSADAAGVVTRDQLTNLLVRKGVISAQDASALPPPPPVVVAAPVGAAPPLIAAAPGGSPFAFRVGNVNFQVGGFLDFETIIRSSNTGNSTATNFGAVPFGNTVAGKQRDMRLTAQNTRLSLKATSNFWGNNVTGYAEMDFNGNDAANVNVNANSHTARLRLAYVDVMRGSWDFAAGQMWSWATPNRVGLSADPNDVFTTYNYDQNYIAGLTWARQAAIRAAWHPNQNLAIGVSLENPDQYVGSGEVLYPFAFNAQLGTQNDNTAVPGAPAFAPDLIPKIAFDAAPMGMHLHAEALGLFRAYRIAVLPTFVNATFDHDVIVTKAGGASAMLEVLPGLTLVGTGMYGEGIGRYAGGLGPDIIVQPFAVAGGFDARILPVTGASGVVGAEWRVTPNDLLAAYGGAAFFHKNSVPDVTSPVAGPPFVGFGGPNSANTNNRVVKEMSFDYIRNIWQDPQYGSLQAGLQFSTVVREPWFVPAGAPKDAISHIGIVNLRYNLPAPMVPAPPPP